MVTLLSNCSNDRFGFNKYLVYDGWKVEVKNAGIEIHHCGIPDVESQLKKESKKDAKVESEADFLAAEFGEISIENLPIEENFKPIVASRLEEVRHNIEVKSSLSAIIMIGSILEGVLLGAALHDMKSLN